MHCFILNLILNINEHEFYSFLGYTRGKLEALYYAEGGQRHEVHGLPVNITYEAINGILVIFNRAK